MQHQNSSHARLHTAARVEPVAIDLLPQRQGSSLLLEVKGTGRGHRSGGVLEDPQRWTVDASLDGEPLKKVLAGPARVAREPTGEALGDQWNVYVSFTIGFAVPDDGRNLLLMVRAPTGERRQVKLKLDDVAPAGVLTTAARD